MLWGKRVYQEVVKDLFLSSKLTGLLAHPPCHPVAFIRD